MSDSLLSNLTGTRDILPAETCVWQFVEDRAREFFARYNYSEIRTPLIEATELFARGIGGETDIVGKEMYTFPDRGDESRSITLRPEATASTVRAYLQHGLNRGAGLTRLYYIGPMFRHEKKQKGRWRQFFQIGAEVLGSDHPAIESEAIEMLLEFLSSLEISATLQVNSVGCPACRPQYIVKLQESLAQLSDKLCEDCQRRAKTNALRVLDCKVERCQPVIDKLPMLHENLCQTCSDHFQRFRKHLDIAGIAYAVVPRLVRGLDYYVRTAFEIVSGDLGAQNALAGGGRYDGLAEVLGGPPTHGFGFALGLDRLIMLLSEKFALEAAPKPDLYLAYMGEAAFIKSLALAGRLRKLGVRCHMEFDGGSLKSQFRLANKVGSKHVLIIGDSELQRGLYQIKRMADSQQREISSEGLEIYFAAAKS
jgi:histidyl-tRNA synthetase